MPTSAGALSLAQVKAKRAVTGKVDPRSPCVLAIRTCPRVPSRFAAVCACESISRGSPDCFPSACFFLARAVLGVAKNRRHGGRCALSSFSRNSRLGE